MKKIQISPSILSADFSQLGNEIKRLEEGGADMIHVDVMDGHFVPNLTIGPPVIKSLRNYTKLPFDVHLMITPVHKYIEDRLEKNANLFNAEVINFPNDAKMDSVKISKAKIDKFWKINDISNNDQLSAVVGICFMFGALILMGLYSNFL